MGQTANYQLNQWVKTDRIQMEDFNSDNAKIDAALKANADAVATKAESATVSALQAALNAKSAFTPLKSGTIAQQATTFSIDVSDVDWSVWEYVLLDLNLKGSGYVVVLPNNSNDGCWNSNTDAEGVVGVVSASQYRRLRFSVAKKSGRNLSAFMEFSSRGGNNSLTYAELNTLNIKTSHNSYYIGAGATWALIGMK